MLVELKDANLIISKNIITDIIWKNNLFLLISSTIIIVLFIEFFINAHNKP